MELHNTLYKMPLKVSVIGDQKTGKRTFLKSLGLTESRTSNGDLIYSLSVNDNKNNVQTNFNFKKVVIEPGNENESFAWLKESVCVILLFDLTNAESFQNGVGPILEEARRHVHETWSFFMLVGNKLDLED